MIKIIISKNSTGSISGFDIKGHSGYAREGYDIICSAVSVTAYTAAGALEEIAGLKNCYSQSDGHMKIRLPEGLTQQQVSTAQIILDTTAIGFRQIELSYGKFVSVVEEEVVSDD